MELKRLLTRANALLLQGAYQGAESFIEQAMAESDKLKSGLSELDTLSTRVTEMAAEVERLSRERQCLAEAIGRIAVASGDTRTEFTGPDLLMACGDAAEGIKHLTAENARLQSVIDEANAQVHSVEVVEAKKGCYMSVIWNGLSKPNIGEKFYARQIPAQQSPIRIQCTHCGTPVNYIGGQSPAVAVPDEMKESLKLAISLLNDDCSFGKADLLQELLNRGYLQSPSITETAVAVPHPITDQLRHVVADAFNAGHEQGRKNPQQKENGLSVAVTMREMYVSSVAQILASLSPRITEQDAR